MIRLTAVIELEGHAPKALTHESSERTVLLGRDKNADFQVPLSTVSRSHARISEANGVYSIEDLGSTHGTALNGAKLPANEKKVLRDGDVLELTKARITVNIQTNQLAQLEPGESTQAIAVKAVEGILGKLDGGQAKPEGPFFHILAGPGEGGRYLLEGGRTEWVFGRSRDCDFVLDDANVSRRHALAKKDWQGVIVQDLNSKNGVVVNGKRIAKPRRLKDRDEVAIGPIRLVFVDPHAELLASLKDVPGFEMDEPEEISGDPSHLGAPSGEDDSGAGPAPGDPEDSEAGAPNDDDSDVSKISDDDDSEVSEVSDDDSEVSDASGLFDEDSDVSQISADLLEDSGRSPMVWIGVGVAALLVLVSAVVLLVIL